MLMQNSFSKCREWVPRGTSQHKWRWLTTLLLILTFGIGQMWAADPTSTYDVSDLISAGTITTSTTNDDLDQTIDNVVYDWNKGGSSSNVKISSQRVQLFGDGQSLTISTSSDYRIKSIRFAVGNKSNSPTAIKESADAGTWAPAFTSSAFSNGNYTFTVTTPTAGGSYTFTIFKSGGTNQRADFDDIVVTYDVAPSDHPTVTYYPNGATSGTVPVDANSPYTSGDNVTVLGNSGNLAKTGMEFVGWNTSADGSGASYLAGNVISDVKANIKLYAQWAYPATGTGTITYALTYDKNEVTPSVSGVSTLSSSSTAFTLSSLTIGVNSDKKPGYSAKIENATADENRNVALQFTVADGYTFAPSDVSMTIYANSTSYMKAKVVLSDGVTTVQSEELECANSADSNIEFASGAFTGKKFVGNVSVTVYLWLTSGSGKRAYIKSPVTITGTVAAAAPKYDVVFANGGEGTGDMATLKYEAGKEVTLPACGYTPVSGREFNGWTSSDVTISAGKFEMPAKNVTITATWRDEAVKYTVAYDVNGGSSATPTETDKAAGDEFALAAAPEYDGYHFEGWLCDVDAVTYDAEDAYTMTAANTTFTAQWKPYSTISIANKTYIIGIGDFNAVSDFSSNCEAAVSYELKESYPGVTLTPAGVFSATAAGEYIVVANQAGDATYAATSKEFTVTVLDNELSDIYIWSKASKYGGDGKCISATDANKDANANAASTTLNYSALAMDGMTSMGRPGGDAVVTLTFSVKGDYSSLFGIKSICTMGKLEEPAGGQISWDNGTTWTALDAYGSGDGEVKTFNAPTGVFPASFKIKFVSASTSVGGLYWRNALVTLEAKKTVTSTVVELNNVKVNGTAISGSELTSLLTNKTLDLATVYTTAPTVTFVKRTTVNYAGGWPADETDENIYVDATDATTNWSASQLINENNYTVTLAKPTVPSLITEATGFTLTSTKVAKDTETFTFSGMNLTSGNVTIALESAVAGMTVSPAEVTPTEGVITDQEVTITYKSVEDVAEANVNLVVYYDADTKIVLPLTYSSTAGIVDLTPISASTTWNWDHANSSTDAIESLDANEIVVFANYSGWVDAFKANSIAGKLQYVYRGNNYAQGHNLKFNTTVPGIVTVTFSNTSTKEVARAPRITDVNGSYAPTDEADGAKTADKKSYSHAVAAGDVLIEGFEMQEGTPANMLRFYEVRFVPTFSVTYMPNGGTGAEYIDDNATEVAEGTLFTAPASSAFVEWNTQADGNGDSYLPGAAVTANLTLFAQWETSYTVTFDLQGHGDAIDPQNIVSGGKVVKPADPSADAWEFGGWYKESTCENEWDFATDVVTTTTTIFAKWTADPCPSPYSLSKVVLTSASDGTVTGYNNDEYAGEKVIGGLNSTETAEVDPSHDGNETGYKLNTGGSAIVFATLKKGTFQVGDRVVVTITKKQDVYKVEEVAQPILDIYYGTDKNDATFLTTIENVTAAGSYTYRLTAADVTAIGSKKGIGVFRPSSGRTQNPYVYSVEIKGCREWAIFHTLTFKNIDGTATIAAESLEEGAYASTVAPAAPKIAMKRFLGWAEATDGTPVDLTTYTITEDKILYAVYEDIVCPTTGTVYKFEIKDELPSENLPTITDKDMSSYITATGDGYLTYTATANNKATINSDGTIQMKDASAAYLKVELECALAAGDQIRAHVTNNPMRVQVGTTYDSNKDLILAKNAYEFVAITSAMEGKQVLYITRSSNGNANLADFEIYRPAKYDVSFDMMGHGTQIADIEDVIEGSKITAPTAPTDADYSFSGWYKENTLENEWNFDVDVVETNTTLYAKWLDKSDATLKSLKYGETEIALVAGVYVYNVSLPAFTSAVPALTAETSNPNATKVIANAAAFDSEGNATSTVTVTPEVGADQGYTVNFAKGVLIPLQEVTGSITWNFANAVTANVSITETPQVLANYGGVTNDNTFESDKLEASGEKFTAGSKANLRANYIRFHTTVPGMLTISYSNTGGNTARYIYVNGAKYDEDGSENTTPKGADNKVFVPAGDVELVMKDGEGASKNVQIYQMIFNATPDYTRPVTEGRYGTICLPNGGVMTGASIYTLAYYGETSQKIFFDEVVDGTMEAGKPYLFLPNEGIDRIGVFYTDAANEPNKTVNGFVGYIGASEDPEDALQVPAGDGNYIVQNNQYREILTGATAYILSHRAYIHFAGINTSEPAKAPGARRIGISGAPQVVTGVDGLNVGDQPVKLIIDGQMYILRGDKMYDATGRLVK